VNGVYCQPCPVGTYSGEGAGSIDGCTACPEGSVAGSTGSTSCTKCTAGTYAVDGIYCDSCPAGTYSEEGARNVEDCLACPDGSVTQYPGSTSCTNCTEGYFSVGGMYCAQ